MPGTRKFSDKTGCAAAFCRNEQALLCRELCNIPTKQVAMKRFAGKSWLFCAVNSGIFRQNKSRGGGLSEWEPVGSLEVRCFSDKTSRTGALCRKKLAVVCRELWDFPTKQVARECFVGKSWLFCAKTSRIFRQIRSPEDVLSE